MTWNGPQQVLTSIEYARVFNQGPPAGGQGGISGPSGASGVSGPRGPHDGGCCGGSSPPPISTPATPVTRAQDGAPGAQGSISENLDGNINRFFP